MSSEPSAAKVPLRCRIFGHSWRRKELLTDNWRHAPGSRAWHTHARIEKCLRCAAEQRVEWFDRDGYWRAVERKREDERLQRNIREALR